jgi:hypothetical protein
MRDDNVADYPWLYFAVTTLMESRARPHGGRRGGILNGLSADAGASFRTRRSATSFTRTGRAARDVPAAAAVGPGVLAAVVLLQLFAQRREGDRRGRAPPRSPWNVTLNDLLTALPCEEPAGPKQQLATTLMGYARRNPDRIRGRLMPVIVYDPRAGRQAFAVAMRKLSPAGPGGVS